MAYSTIKKVHKKIQPYLIKCFKNYKLIVSCFIILIIVSISIECLSTFWYKIFYNSLANKEIKKMFLIIPIYLGIITINEFIHSLIFMYKNRIIYKISETMYQENYHFIKKTKHTTSNQRIIDDLTEISMFYFESMQVILTSVLKIITFGIILIFSLRFGIIFAVASTIIPLAGKYLLDPISKPLSKITYIQEEIIAKLKNKIYEKKNHDFSRSFWKISNISNKLKFKESVILFVSNSFKNVLDIFSYLIFIPVFLYDKSFLIGNFMQSSTSSRRMLFSVLDIIFLRQNSFKNQGILRRINELTNEYIE